MKSGEGHFTDQQRRDAAAFLREQRDLRAWDQDDIAERLPRERVGIPARGPGSPAVTRQWISRIENGTIPWLNRRRLLEFARAWGLSVAEANDFFVTKLGLDSLDAEEIRTLDPVPHAVRWHASGSVGGDAPLAAAPFDPAAQSQRMDAGAGIPDETLPTTGKLEDLMLPTRMSSGETELPGRTTPPSSVGTALRSEHNIVLANDRPTGPPKCDLITNFAELLRAKVEIVEEAETILVMVGSRARDLSYLKAIEAKLSRAEGLIHYRILQGPPHHQMLKDHLLELLKIRDPYSRHRGRQTLFIGQFDDAIREGEFNYCSNEKQALIILPSFGGVGEYDSAVLIDNKDYVSGLINHAKQLYSASSPIERAKRVQSLQIVRTPVVPARGA